jgi:hypothetical protein
MQDSSECQFRRAGGGREPMAPPGAGGMHVHYSARERVGIGCVTSRPLRPTFYDLLAAELGVDVGTAKKLHEKGLVN